MDIGGVLRDSRVTTEQWQAVGILTPEDFRTIVDPG